MNPIIYNLFHLISESIFWKYTNPLSIFGLYYGIVFSRDYAIVCSYVNISAEMIGHCWKHLLKHIFSRQPCINIIITAAVNVKTQAEKGQHTQKSF